MTESVAADEVDETTVPDLGSAERVLKRDETSAVLRLSEAEAAELAGDPDDQPTGTADDPVCLADLAVLNPLHRVADLANHPARFAAHERVAAKMFAALDRLE